MLAVYCAVAAIGGLLIGFGTGPALSSFRGGRAKGESATVRAPAVPVPPSAPAREEHDALAGELLDLAYTEDLAEVRRRATALALRFGGSLISPEEQTPFDERLHTSDRFVRTADSMRHGVTAGVIRPGLCNRNGVVLRPAVVYRYTWKGRP